MSDVEDCPPGKATEVIAGEQVIALYNVDGQFYALDGVCPHQGGPLGGGSLDKCTVTCPWHGWQFDVRTGQHLTSQSVKQPGFATRVNEDWVEVESLAAK